MANYSVYTCSVCHKDQTVKNNSTGIVINQCQATENCLGTILKTGEADAPIFNIFAKTSSVLKEDPLIEYYLTNSKLGAFNLALKCSPVFFENNPVLRVNFKKETKSKEIKRKYFFQPKVGTLTLSGKDTKNNQLQIDPTFLAEDVTILVDGTQMLTSNYDLPWSASSLKFKTEVAKDSQVEIIISNKIVYATYSVDFVSSEVQNENFYAWSNIKFIEKHNYRFYLYSCENLTLPVSSTFKIESVTDGAGNLLLDECLWLLSDYPFSQADRRTDICVENLQLKNDFGIKSSSSIPVLLSVTEDKIKEIYPPLKILGDAFKSADLVTSTSVTETIFPIYKNKTILTNSA